MDIKVLREFIDLAFTLSFSKTAERVFISQPALSKHIVLLEKELGVQLFVRNKQSVRLTPIGTTLRDRFKKVVSEYDNALSIICQEFEDIHGFLRIGYLDAAVKKLLSKCIRSYTDKYPNMKVSFASYEVGELSDALRQDAIDIALSISFPNSSIPQDTYFRPLYNDGISAVVSKDNPLANRDEIMFEELLDYPMVLPSPIQYPSYASIIREMVESSPREANIICDYSNVNTALIMVESEMGVTILPSNISNIFTTASFIKIKEANQVLQVGVMWKKSCSIPGIEQFVDIICDLAADMYYKNNI